MGRKNAVASFAWPAFLEEWARDLLHKEEIARELPPSMIVSGQLVMTGASEAELADLETHLDRALPASYRRFLAVSNGWPRLDLTGRRLLPTTEVEWFTVEHQDWAEGFVDGERMSGSGARRIRSQREFFANALAISDDTDVGIYLLNPLVIDVDGEWQACLFANWLPGVATYASFTDLIRALREEHP
jgi:hypothetical protein